MYFKINKDSNLQVIISMVRIFLDLLEISTIKKHETQTIVSEIIQNIQKYTPGGNIDISYDKNNIKIVAQDQGGGIKDVNKAFSDGYSSGGTLGFGLPAVIRLSDDFHAQTSQTGTTITVIKSLK